MATTTCRGEPDRLQATFLAGLRSSHQCRSVQLDTALALRRLPAPRAQPGARLRRGQLTVQLDVPGLRHGDQYLGAVQMGFPLEFHAASELPENRHSNRRTVFSLRLSNRQSPILLLSLSLARPRQVAYADFLYAQRSPRRFFAVPRICKESHLKESAKNPSLLN